MNEPMTEFYVQPVPALRELQEKILMMIYETGDCEAEAERRIALNEVYDLTVAQLLNILGEDASVTAVDMDMAEVFRNVYKSDFGVHMRGATYRYAKKYLADRREK